jgi:hypothetical protein
MSGIRILRDVLLPVDRSSQLEHFQEAAMGFIGKLVHIGLDAIVISALLAGIHRSTGLT